MAEPIFNNDVGEILRQRQEQFRELSRPRGSLGAVDAEAQIRRQVKAAVSQGMAERYSDIFRERERMLEAASKKRLSKEEIEKSMDAERGFWRR